MFVEDVAFLFAETAIATVGTNIFFSTRAKLPLGDGPYVSLIETGGLSPLRVHNWVDQPAYQRPAAQVVVRAKNYVVARDFALALYNIVFAVRNRIVNQTWYQEMVCLQEPFDAGTDDQGRAKVVFNIRSVRRLL